MTADEAYKMWELAMNTARAEAFFGQSGESLGVYGRRHDELMAARKELADYINSFVKEWI